MDKPSGKPVMRVRSFITYVSLSVFLLWNFSMLARLVLSRTHQIFPTNSWNNAGANNATLGFGAILALTSNDAETRMSWRVEGLKQAATYTGLEIQYPRQPEWSDSDVEDLKENNGAGSLNTGSALCWLGHMHMLRQATQHTTTLILEDDADWDVDIRTQIVKVAEAVRNLTQSTVLEDSEDPDKKYPYGMNWDVLWLGHCGSSILEKQVNFHDPTIPPEAESFNPLVKSNVGKLRYVHETVDPLCLYAYAVTQESAKKILRKHTHGNTEGIDIWFLNMCREGKLRCVAVSPELFHEHEAAGVHDSYINGQDPQRVIDFERTTNIWHSARCNSRLHAKEHITCPNQFNDPEAGLSVGEGEQAGHA